MTEKLKNGGENCNTEIEPTIWKWRPTGPPPPWAHALFLTELGSRIEFLVVDNQLSKERIERLLTTYGGVVCESMSIVSTKAVILVEDNFCPPPSWGPCFSRRFARDCIESFTLLELNDYIVGVDPHSPTSESISKALYFDRQLFRPEPLPITFFLPDFSACVPNTQPLRKLDHTRRQKTLFTIMYGCVCKCHKNSISYDNCEDHSKNDSSKKANENINQTNAVSSNNQVLVGSIANNMSPACESETIHSKNQLNVSTNVSCDEGSQCQTDNVNKTTDLKSQSEVIKVKKKKLLIKISDLYDFPTPQEDRTLLGSRCSNDSTNSVMKIQQTPTSSKLEKKGKSSQTKNIPSKNSESTEISKEKAKTSPLSNVKVSSTCEETKSSEQSDSDVSLPDLNMWPNLKKHSDSKHSRKPYSRREQERILKYIISKKAYTRLKSDALYREMEDRKICHNRTYQSMKNHFLKTILTKLDTFEFLTERKKQYLRGEIQQLTIQ